ncbi:MAG: hypothetical protein IPP79_20745 [Chitinophagaceae bacterium]|nr:hypothetical protein [Chitinophagaceae bacterium]
MSIPASEGYLDWSFVISPAQSTWDIFGIDTRTKRSFERDTSTNEFLFPNLITKQYLKDTFNSSPNLPRGLTIILMPSPVIGVPGFEDYVYKNLMLLDKKGIPATIVI